MIIIWTDSADFCLDHIVLYLKINGVDIETVRKVISTIKHAPQKLLQFPRMGRLIKTSDRKEIRRILVKDYKISYELRDDIIFILKVLHDKEDIEGI